MNITIRHQPKTMSIDLNLVTIQDAYYLLKNNQGYIDGDRHTLELFIEEKKKTE